MLQWIKYFPVGIEKTALNAVDTLSKVIQLKNDLESQINLDFGRRSNSALTLLNNLFQSPDTTIDNAAKKCSLSYKAANDLIRLMQGKKIVGKLICFMFKPSVSI
jgi:hypothetical protein